MKSRRMLLIAIFLYSNLLFAITKWPTFVAPDKEFFLQHHLIEASGCEINQGRIKQNFFLNIKQHFCKTFCPGNWQWILTSDNECHSLTEGYNIQKINIQSIQNKDSTTNHSIISVLYGDSKEPHYYASAIFISPINEFWHCSSIDNSQQLFCTNDI